LGKQNFWKFAISLYSCFLNFPDNANSGINRNSLFVGARIIAVVLYGDMFQMSIAYALTTGRILTKLTESREG
jgi:hypothetical protein